MASTTPTHPVTADRAASLPEACCGDRVGDRRVRLPRRERSVASRLGAAVRRIIAR